MTIFLYLSQKLWSSVSNHCHKNYQYLNQNYWLLLMQKTGSFEVVSDWIDQFPKFPDKFSGISIENPLASFKNLNENEETSSLATTKLITRVVGLATKLKKWLAWRFKQVASLPSQIVWFFLKIPFIEKNLLYPRYQKYLRDYQNQLPVLDSIDSKIVDELQKTGICVTSLESLGLPNTSEFLKAAKRLSQELKEISLLPVNQGKYEVLATSAQLMKYKELFQWGLNDRLLKIVERYLGLPVAYDGLLSVLSIANGQEIGQRAWHRDREDRRMVKVCVYLNDVTDEGGPFECLQPEINSLVCKSIENRYRCVFNEEMKTFFPAASDQVTTCTGAVGTVIFVDTALYYHRGKPPTQLNRSAIFFSYFSRRPWHPFFCQRSPLSKQERDRLTKGMSSHQRDCTHWTENLPRLIQLIPPSRI
ncbi:MAG TPA: hypothetical protein DCE56_11045 [Cyanobacteria bacterium UBA8553]|nr:hypothetical protein [Cyanobacteria bacterium UBA8553]HAJ63676.1 hypothetical protein [Cyanobacteria bacterium UBA8543]